MKRQEQGTYDIPVVDVRLDEQRIGVGENVDKLIRDLVAALSADAGAYVLLFDFGLEYGGCHVNLELCA
jgi:hypothetical protein